MIKRILVTGGAGFIGSYLCEKLIEQGHSVICCDNFYTGNKNNLEKILDNKNFELIKHDVTFPLFLEVDLGVGGIETNKTIIKEQILLFQYGMNMIIAGFILMRVTFQKSITLTLIVI